MLKGQFGKIGDKKNKHLIYIKEAENTTSSNSKSVSVGDGHLWRRVWTNHDFPTANGHFREPKSEVIPIESCPTFEMNKEIKEIKTTA